MAIDLTPLYRNSVGFDRFASLLDNALRSEATPQNYPPYNIEVTGDDKYAVTLAVAGFERDELDIQVENGVLTVHGKKAGNNESRQFLYQGIASREFERTFNLAEHVEVTGADLNNGLLTIGLVKRIPEEMKPKRIEINSSSAVIEHDSGKRESGNRETDSSNDDNRSNSEAA